MKIAVGQQALETTDRFILFPAEHEVWHVCRYKAGALKVSPGTACETPCEATVLPKAEALPTEAELYAARVAAADHQAVAAAERAAAGSVAAPPVPPDIQKQRDELEAQLAAAPAAPVEQAEAAVEAKEPELEAEPVKPSHRGRHSK